MQIISECRKYRLFFFKYFAYFSHFYDEMCVRFDDGDDDENRQNGIKLSNGKRE